jgi:hypothetical protein
MDRVAIVASCWFILWVVLGLAIGSVGFNTPWTGGLTGFAFALLAMLAWPWIMPEPINAWMDEEPA